MNRTKSDELYKKAITLFPGGVNSPVRALKSVDGNPIFIEKGAGSKITDADGNEYIDYCCSWGPLILGHNNPNVISEVKKAIDKGMSFGAPTAYENELAELILGNHNYIEKIRFVSSGTEAVMSAIRLARGATGRNKIIKFDGCYHGHADHLLVKAGSGLATFGTSSSAGVPEAFANETIILPLNDKEAVKRAFDDYEGDIACIIIEPVPANNGLLIQNKDYLEFLREITAANDSLLIFDEVINGFRIGFEGAAGHYNIQPDILTYGKIIGGGMPVGAYGASTEIMSNIAPDGAVYQAGTLSGNPVAMAAGIAQLKECLKPGFYKLLEEKTEFLTSSIETYAIDKGYEFRFQKIASIFWIAFSYKDAIKAADEIDASNMEKFRILHRELLERGIYLGPSGYEVGFVSAAHSQEDLDKTIQAFKKSLDIVFA
ncbi:MAG: glutamate-1-semialdehyde 2,1-aminomutase [Flavobacteriales bacterium]|nr:glutamate-1-semialdehyde 2,1-aminomutase [Flavobacteriales bacterium]